MTKSIALEDKFASFSEHWRPKTLAECNGQEVRIAKTQGVFPWHSHADADELFLCWRGEFQVEMRSHIVTLRPGELVVVPRGVEHRTMSEGEAEVLIMNMRDAVNTGDAPPSEFTAPLGVAI